MRERLIELLKGNLPHFTNDIAFWNGEHIGELADHLLANGVIVAPMPMANWLKAELTEYVHNRCMEEL